ncbi:MAG: glutamine synthetase adenylyltransferase, partial [Anaerolineae bacterium]|nr:glutamine synthetase adenylyltransferase [Anaerolineae bacterium]
SPRLLLEDTYDADQACDLLTRAGFKDWQTAWRLLKRLGRDDKKRLSLAEILPDLLLYISGAAGADRVLVYFDRFAGSLSQPESFYHYLKEHPRAIEIMVTLFSNSQFLSEILLRKPEYLQWITEHKNLYRPKRLEALYQETLNVAGEFKSLPEQMDALRRFQRRELLRIGLCDLLDQFDLTAATRQLSHLADSILRVSLHLAAQELNVTLNEKGAPVGFAVIAMGKLGGRELNYSSDIDLIFVCDHDEDVYQRLGQKVIDSLTRVTAEGFLYRVDMRLRPWGHVGALVPAISSYLNYLKGPARLWEKQAMLKARWMAGDEQVSNDLIQQTGLLLYNFNPEVIRSEVAGMKQMTEDFLRQKGRTWGEVKLGQGSIRDIEFVVQYLQLSFGGKQPEIRNRNTLEALRRLVKYNLLPVDEFRLLTEGYTFLRTIEHHLQMMDYRQTYSLPAEPEALNDLALRLGFQGEAAGEQFVARYQQYSTAIRQVYLKYMESPEMETSSDHQSATPEIRHHIERMDPSYETVFSHQDIRRHAALAQKLDNEHLVMVEAVGLEDDFWRVTIVAYDYPGELSLICGLMFVYGFNIHDGNAFTYESPKPDNDKNSHRKIVDVFTVKCTNRRLSREIWNQYALDLETLLKRMQSGQRQEARIDLAKRAAASLTGRKGLAAPLYPIEIKIDNDSSEKYSLLRIDAMDTIGFLYELTNALAFNQVYIARMEIETSGNRINDILYVTGADGKKILSPTHQRELRAATVLIKHFTHLLPHSPDPESALLHFREFISQLFRHPDWPDELASLERSDVMEALAQLLGVSDFLWYDFLRMQHANLFPVVRDVDALQTAKPREQLQNELEIVLKEVHNGPQPPVDEAPWCNALNEFKDREMFRIDMRHILGHTKEFWEFSEELTDLTEVVINAALHLTSEDLRLVYGSPRLEDGELSQLSICALGKCGGREMGFASDIELMFIYSGNGKTDGPKVVSNGEFFEKVVENFVKTIRARREGIFQVDLQLRPYGKAGNLSISLESFRRYFVPGGAAWSYERQALVRLRPIAGDEVLGQRVAALRDAYIYNGEPFDVVAMRGMRERQIRHLVKVGTFNPKYSPGGLVDIEYLVQGLQITHGASDPELRCTNTRAGMAALSNAGFLPEEDYTHLRKAHTFLRWLIDSLRVVAGNAKDLVVPPEDSEEFAFLARRLRYGDNINLLSQDMKQHTAYVQEVNRRLLGG